MRRATFFFAAFLLTALPAAAETLNVQMDQSAALRLSVPARDVVIGNPNIADVNLLDARRLVVIGKSFGVTNLLVMDQAGRTILDRTIVVSAAAPSMKYFRGDEVRNYACTDRCEQISSSQGSVAAVAAATPQAPTTTP